MMQTTEPKALFSPGSIVATPGALRAIGLAGPALLSRHIKGDWGDLGDEDKRSNDLALRSGARLLSAYRVNGQKVWVITEWDRSTTTILLPDEY